MLRVNAIQCGAICLIALLAASSDREPNQERGASKQLAPQSAAARATALLSK